MIRRLRSTDPTRSPLLLFAGVMISLTVAIPSVAVAQQAFTHRLTSISYDFDNNGTPDATKTISYDGAGRGTGVTYTYVDDGTVDLLNTEDDDAASELTVVGYNGDDLIDVFDLDRTLMPSGTESVDTTYTYTSGLLTRFDATETVNGSTGAFYGDFSYVSNLISSIAVRNAADDSIIFLHNFTNDPDGLPSTLSILAGVTTTVDMNWRPDGQLDDLTSTSGFGAIVTGSGTADYTYGANGQILDELWTATVGSGPHFAEFPFETYRKTYTYDAQLLKTTEEYDLDDDGNVDAVLTFTWTPGTCVPAFIFAPNGRPNFARMDGFPYTPGTGSEWLENCGPYLVDSEPSAVPGLTPWAWLALVASLVWLAVPFATREAESANHRA